MTSSLVGSEMCIRDSAIGELQDVVAEMFVHHEMVVRNTKFHSTTQRAVSYTHLTLPTICSV
eukprot:2116297-Prorocentrum_lima.AAC.1